MRIAQNFVLEEASIVIWFEGRLPLSFFRCIFISKFLNFISPLKSEILSVMKQPSFNYSSMSLSSKRNAFISLSFSLQHYHFTITSIKSIQLSQTIAHPLHATRQPRGQRKFVFAIFLRTILVPWPSDFPDNPLFTTILVPWPSVFCAIFNWRSSFRDFVKQCAFIYRHVREAQHTGAVTLVMKFHLNSLFLNLPTALYWSWYSWRINLLTCLVHVQY